MRKLSRREIGLLGLAGLGALLFGVRWLRRTDAVPLLGASSQAAASGPAVARIGLARLDAPRPESEAGHRNLFAFGERVVEESEAPMIVPTPPPALTPAPDKNAANGSSTPSLPPLNVKYIGSVESATGVKIAVLVTDRKEVLTGQAGQVVANRYRVAHIGLESVDLEDVSTGQSRRVPLRAQ